MAPIAAKKIPFADALPHLKVAIDDGEAILKAQCEQSQAQCWELNGGQAYMLTRTEYISTGAELVVCCFEGANMREIGKAITKAAQESGYRSIRFHTQRPAIARLINQAFELQEYVFRQVI